MAAELKFPVVAHQRIIVNAAQRDDARAKACFADFDLPEPLTVANVSSGGKYVSYAISVRLADRDEMARFDEAVKRVPGIKMCL